MWIKIRDIVLALVLIMLLPTAEYWLQEINKTEDKGR